MSVGLNAQVYHFRITNATITTKSADGFQVVKDYPASFVDVDQNAQIIVVQTKEKSNTILNYDRLITDSNTSLCKRVEYNYNGNLVCDMQISFDSLRGDLTIILTDGAVLSLSGKYLE